MARLDLERAAFPASHASSFLPFQGSMPRDRQILPTEINAILRDERVLIRDFPGIQAWPILGARCAASGADRRDGSPYRFAQFVRKLL